MHLAIQSILTGISLHGRIPKMMGDVDITVDDLWSNFHLKNGQSNYVPIKFSSFGI